MPSANPYLPPPERCEALAVVAAQVGGSVTPLIVEGAATAGESTVIEYSLPVHAEAEVRDYLRASARLECPPLVVACLPGGRVFGPGQVLSPDGTAIARDVSLDFGKGPDDHWLLHYQKIRPPERRPGCTAVVATSLGAGYCHWLLEELPRLVAVAPRLSEGATVMMHLRAPFAREAFAHLGYDVPLLEPARLAHLQCEDLIVPSLLGPEGRPTPAVVAALAGVAERMRTTEVSEKAGWGERIYISRDRARRRRVSNEATLWPMLAARGFRRLTLEEMPWREQVAVFCAAKVIVAPHGAGLANLAWCQPGTRVVEFFNRSYVNGLFWQLAALKGLDYRPLVPTGGQPIGETLTANKEDIEADVAQVLGAADAL